MVRTDPGRGRARRSQLTLERGAARRVPDRKSTRLNSSHSQISYAVFCLKKKNHLTVSPPAPQMVPYPPSHHRNSPVVHTHLFHPRLLPLATKATCSACSTLRSLVEH